MVIISCVLVTGVRTVVAFVNLFAAVGVVQVVVSSAQIHLMEANH